MSGFAHPDRIGDYRILEPIGEGGMGTVYLAEQERPVRRRVALKLVKLGMDTREVVARFESERQALAMMNHPNVAAVYDAGATESGRPYFVMEYVPGEPITSYCDKHRLSIHERLELFITVCNAVQHAHTKGIIHRDIKPSNILVMLHDGKPTPKVIDFGVAKATNQRLTEHTIFTQQGLLIGTPEYMSPEQAEMSQLDIDTRTDVYSLGVLLYELLTGTLPFDPRTLRAAGYAAIKQVIREKEPPKPSTRLSALREQVTFKPDPLVLKTDQPQRLLQAMDATLPRGMAADHPAAKPDIQKALLDRANAQAIAAPSAYSTTLLEIADRRRTEPKTLLGLVRGDLDWIVMKCLEKDRTRRYETANGLALEVRRYLANEPVLAGPPGTGYRLRKFIRRNRVAVFAGALIAATLLLGVIGTTSGMVWAQRERRRAEAQTVLARKEAENASQAEAEQSRQRERAERAAASETRQREKSEKVADFMSGIFEGVGPSVALGRDTAMLRELLDAAAKRIDAGELSRNPEAEIRLRLSLGETYRQIAAYDAAERMLTPAEQLARTTFGREHAELAEAMSTNALLLKDMGRLQDALSIFAAALEMRQRLFKGDHPSVATDLNSVASCLRSLGREVEALPKYEAALEMYERLFKGDHPDVATTLSNVAFCLRSLGRAVEAQPKYEAAMEMRQRLFKGDHPDVAASLGNVASCLDSLGRSTAALPKHEAALEMYQRLYKGDHPDVASSLSNMAFCLGSLGRSAEALPKHEAALGMYQRLYKGDHPDVAASLNNVAFCLDSLGRSAEALPKYEAALEMSQRLFKGDHPAVATNLNNVAFCLDNLGRAAEALPELQAALEMRQRLYKGDHPDVASSLNNIAFCLVSLGHQAEALPKLEAALEMYQRLSKGDHPDVATSLGNVASCLDILGRSAEALPKHEAALKMYQRFYKGDHPAIASGLNKVASCLASLDRPAEALPKYQAAMEMRKRILPSNHVDTKISECGMGSALVELGRFQEAEPLLLEVWPVLSNSPGAAPRHKLRCLEAMVKLYDGWHIAEPTKGYDEKAAEWREKLKAWQATTQPASTQPTSQAAPAQSATSQASTSQMSSSS
jgi:serine/threonine protein kinase/tetratricopeptide (TPR) repeat protein